MKATEILRIGKELLKIMSEFDLRTSDYKYLALYDEYVKMRAENEKVEYILLCLSHKYKLSQSTIKRVVRRLSKEVRK